MLAAGSALAILTLAPPPGDASAHLYRTWLVDRGVIFWDNLWFAGSYPIVTYSPLYYVLAVLLGNTLLTVFGALAAAGCFALLAVREWGPIAAWPARCFGVCAAGPLITGTAPYGLGLAAGLACLLALQRGWQKAALGLAAATLAFSALAFLFLSLTMIAVALSQRCDRRSAIVVGAGMAFLFGCWAASWALFPTAGRYPFNWWTLLIVVAVSGCAMTLAVRAERARGIAALFALWMLSSIALFVVPTPIGEIVTRLRYVVFPLVLLTVLLGGARPRWLAAITLAGAAAYNLAPYAASLAVRIEGDDNAAEQSYWQPTIDFLTDHHTPDHLVAVVATGAHWETYYLPRAGIPVVRGWYRQIDIARNGVLYEGSSSPADYRRWLHDNAVRFVVLPDVRLDPHTGDREARLVTATETGLIPVLRDDDVTIYEVPRPDRLLSGHAPARVLQLTHGELRAFVAAAGEYQLQLTWSPYWQVIEGDVSLRENDADGTVVVDAAEAGSFRLAVRANALLP